MKKNLAIVLALVLVLCATVALAASKYEPAEGNKHKFYADTNVATYTTLDCDFVSKETKTESFIVSIGKDDVHQKVTNTYTAGICNLCHDPMNDNTVVLKDGTSFNYHLKTQTVSLEAHKLARGAYKGFFTVEELGQKKIAHNDYTHLVGYDKYESVCTVFGCTQVVYEMVPVYKAHEFATKAVTYDKNGNKAPQKNFGNTCKLCGYTRVYKDMTTAAAQKVAEIIAAYEAAGMTVEFDADQLIAVGIEEGEVGEVEGCGVATINFSNWTPVNKKDTGKQVIDNGYVDNKIKTEKNGKTVYQTSVKNYDEWATVKPGVKTQPILGIVDRGPDDHAVNFNQEAKTYGAAYVTMTVDGADHRVYFYKRHDNAGWVYAFEADMADGTYKVAKLSNGETARAARCGAGQEYATVGAYFVGTELTTIGTAYETEGYNTSWKWAMVGDFEFVCIGK